MANANATRTLLKARWWHTDEYVGTAEQLCACGLVQPGQFPGQPGRGKVRVTYFISDGQPVPHGCSDLEQTYTVQRVSLTRFSVSVSLSDQEIQRRRAIPNNKRGGLPLDLPEAPAFEVPTAPTWAPPGFVFRRNRDPDYVFEATIEHLRQSGVMEGQLLPVIDDQRAKSVRFRSLQFGWTTVRQRTARTFFVVLKSPREIRNADYRTRDYGTAVYHEGTKQQLQERGLGVGIGFPGEPGCHIRKVTVPTTQPGAKLRIELLHPSEWFGEVPRFEVEVRRSEAEQEALKKAKQEAEAEKARLERLKTMPATPEKFRDDVADCFWTWVKFTKRQMESSDGYRFTSDVVDEFVETVSEAYWTIKNGDTTGCSPRKKLQLVLGESAKADKPLQRFLANLSSGASE